ncbi:MAG: diguanylate cyclase, partial [Methylococcales bacterium]|nr:diguanylate cyclase [Methylococcales bacterium]
VRIDVALADGRLGLMITDNWGTLLPSIFLRKLADSMDGGVEAGVGGAGLYMMWRLSDYFQIRVHPQHRTQITTLWDLNNTVDMDTTSGFQFIHHSDYEPVDKNKMRT